MDSEKPKDEVPIFLQDANWREELKAIVREIVGEVVDQRLANYSHDCRFKITDKEANELGHCIGMISDLGQGRVGTGVEIIRDNHKWLKSQRDRGEKLSMAFFLIVLSTMVSGVFAALWLGVKHMIGSK